MTIATESAEDRSVIIKRCICWPHPDATCLQGGCSYCNEYRLRAVTVIRRYAENAGMIPHRAQGEQLAIKAFNYGLQRGWPGVRVRRA